MIFDGKNEVLKELLSDGIFLSNTAKVMAKMYKELRKVGFNKDQSISIVSNFKIVNN